MGNRQKPTDESLELPELSAEDQAELDAMLADPPSYHTLLQVWREVLKPAADEALQPPTAGWASRITQMFPLVKVQEMGDYRDIYYAKIAELVRILELEIESDPSALDHLDVESDREENRDHYKNLLLLWQQACFSWELNWVHDTPTAHLELAAISEVHKMFFSQTGLVNMLDNIGFQFSEDDQQELAQALEEMKGGDRE